MIPTTAPSPLNPWLNPCLVPQEDKQEQHLGIIDSYPSPRCQNGIISLHIALACHTLYTAARCRYRIQSSSENKQTQPLRWKLPTQQQEGRKKMNTLKKKKNLQEVLLATFPQRGGTLTYLLSPWRFYFRNTAFADFSHAWTAESRLCEAVYR